MPDYLASTDLYSPLTDFFVSRVFLLGIADAHDGSFKQRRMAHMKEAAGFKELWCCDMNISEKLIYSVYP